MFSRRRSKDRTATAEEGEKVKDAATEGVRLLDVASYG